MTRTNLAGPVEVRMRKRTADTFSVFGTELEALRSNYSSLHAVFLGMAFGVLVAVVVALLTTDLGAARPYFAAAAFAFGPLSGFYLTLVVRDARRANGLVAGITAPNRRRPVNRGFVARQSRGQRKPKVRS